MATVPHVTSGLGLRKFQADGFLLTRVYHFKIIETPTCPCGNKDQTIDHLLLECELLKKERVSLISAASKSDGWPIRKYTLISKPYKPFVRFTNQISFDKLNESIIPRI